MFAKIIGFLAKATAMDVINWIFFVLKAAIERGKKGSCGPSKVKSPS